METLPKAVVLFGLELSASVYIGIGVFGSVVETSPPMGLYLSVWTSLLFGAALLACIRGIYYFGTLRDRIAAREADAATARKISEVLPGGAPP